MSCIKRLKTNRNEKDFNDKPTQHETICPFAATLHGWQRCNWYTFSRCCNLGKSEVTQQSATLQQRCINVACWLNGREVILQKIWKKNWWGGEANFRFHSKRNSYNKRVRVCHCFTMSIHNNSHMKVVVNCWHFHLNTHVWCEAFHDQWCSRFFVKIWINLENQLPASTSIVYDLW